MEVIKKKKKFKINWNKYKTMILISFLVSVIGFFIVSNTLPKFIKDRSKTAVYFTKKPLDIRFKMENYTVYVNEKVFNNIGDKTSKVINNIKDIPNKFTQSGKDADNINKIVNTIYKIKENIIGAFAGRGVK